MESIWNPVHSKPRSTRSREANLAPRNLECPPPNPLWQPPKIPEPRLKISFNKSTAHNKAFLSSAASITADPAAAPRARSMGTTIAIIITFRAPRRAILYPSSLLSLLESRTYSVLENARKRARAAATIHPSVGFAEKALKKSCERALQYNNPGGRGGGRDSRPSFVQLSLRFTWRT